MRILFILSLVLFGVVLVAQTNPVPPTPAPIRMDALQKRTDLEQQSIVNTIPFRSVGPTVFSGRVTDVAVNEQDPSHFYVAYASGGLWKTENNGTTFSPVFDHEAVMTIGDIAVHWQDSTIWVGTGEVNSSRSSYAGVGLYKGSIDGKKWQYMGLGESHHIGRIVLHPTNPNILWVAVLGHLYSPNEERGVYKTTDGGKTWEKTLFVNENTGAVDLLLAPNAPNTLYATMWHRERRAWNFVESGKGSGIYKSTDGGENWQLLTTSDSGFPTGEGVGRIGIDLYHDKSGKTVLYALLDNYNRRPAETEKEVGLTKEALRTMSREQFLKIPTKDLKNYLKNNGFHEKYDTETVTTMVRSNEIQPIALVEYLEDANAMLFDTPVIGAEVYRSEDGGKTWNKTHKDYLDFVYNSYGYYFGQIRVSPHDADKIYFAGVPIVRSNDGGKTFTNINQENVHVDHHALWLNPNRDQHLILGNDGGINISYDDGASWIKCNSPAVGQFYAVAVDNAEPYNIYGGLQDNGVWVGPSTYQASKRWHNTGHYPYTELLGGDGMQIAIDDRDNNTVITGFQFGWYYRINQATKERTLIKPQHDLGERPLRFNWQTPIHLSTHNQDILYLGSHKVHRSFNQGDDWEAISGDLTNGGIKGDVPYGTISTIDESPFQFGHLYVGTDDGNIHTTRDGGATWQQISDGLPQHRWVTTVYASRHVKGRVYCSLNGYRSDDFKAYIYKSDDYGNTWQSIGTPLPAEPVNVIYEDPTNENLLFVGTDHGLYVSLNQGSTFMLLNNGLPAVAVHDVVVQPKAQDLVVGTHGRSIYVADIAPLQALTPEVLAKDLVLFSLKKWKENSDLGKEPNIWVKSFSDTMSVVFYTKQATTATLNIATQDGVLLKNIRTDATQGLNYVPYDFSIDDRQVPAYERFLQKANDDFEGLEQAEDGRYYLRAGKYKVTIETSYGKDSQAWEVEE